MEKKFIITTDVDSARALEKAGYRLMNFTNSRYVFLNNNGKNNVALFEKLKDIANTNTLFL